MTQKLHSCNFCNYTTLRKFDLKRHHNNKHITEYINNEKGKKVHPNENKVHPNENKVHSKDKNQIITNYLCKKCNKIYLTYKSFIKHESNCNGLDNLTCPRCMKSFSSKQAKCNHIKRDTCKPRSIVYAKTPNIQNIINNIDNSITNNTNNITNNFIINNFGNERIDYLTFDILEKILIKGLKSIPLLVEEKHFNTNFPENNNIKGIKNKNNKCLLRKDNEWYIANLSIISDKIIKDNSELLLNFSETNKEELTTIISNDELYDYYNDKLLQIKYKSNKDEYKNVKDKIKDIINNNV